MGVLVSFALFVAKHRSIVFALSDPVTTPPTRRTTVKSAKMTPTEAKILVMDNKETDLSFSTLWKDDGE